MNFGLLLKASGWIVAFSVLMFIGGAILVPIVVLRMHENFFIEEEKGGWHFPKSALGWAFWVLRNLVGLLLVLVGIPMLVGPGQGILTIAAGLMALTVPGKRKLILWMVKKGRMQRTLNWIRKKGHKPPLHFSHPVASSAGNFGHTRDLDASGVGRPGR